MSRGSNGVYTLPNSAFVAGTVISSSVVNSNFSDISSTLTLSVDTRGYSSMTGVFKAFAGSSVAPGITFASDTTSGFYSVGAGSFSLVTSNTVLATFASDQAVTWTGAQTFSSTISVAGAATFNSTVSITGAVTLSGALNVASYETFTDQGSDPSTPAAAKVNMYTKVDGYNSGGRPYMQDEIGRIFPIMGTFGQCRLTLVAGSLTLSPYFGNRLSIDGVPKIIPDAGITLSSSGTAASTFYYIYVYMSGATMTLEYSTTVPVLQAGTGLYSKTGDSTRTLVGAAYTTAAPAWADTDGTLYVLSYFNRKKKKSVTRFTADRSTSSATYVELNSEIRNQYINWSDEIVEIQLNTVMNNAAGVNNYIGLATDNATQEVTSRFFIGTGNDFNNMSLTNTKTGLTENALHYATMVAKSDGINSITAKGTALTADMPTYITLYVAG